ncbi:MAG: transglutaminase N-terminal domain-containing protein [Steroidobacteraceae bacterium]
MRRLKIIHRTYYNFSGTVQLEPHRLLLHPREGHQLRVESSSLEISPTATLRWLRDAYDNSVAIASFDTPATQLAILSEVIVQHYDTAPLDFMVADYAVNYPFEYAADASPILQPYLLEQAADDRNELRAWVEKFWQPGEAVQTYVLLQRLCVGINETLTYQMREEPGVQTAAETLALNSGSCRDFANLFMEAVRYLGLAARFVSGYLYAPNSGYDFGATHAWAEVYLPGAGWKGFDPTIGEMASHKHIPVAMARLPQSVPPVSGSFFGPPGASLHVGVWVTEL